ncbi:MAG: helix-turn-helix transcriptional regulator [Ilumatobacteraceae bacterium]
MSQSGTRRLEDLRRLRRVRDRIVATTPSRSTSGAGSRRTHVGRTPRPAVRAAYGESVYSYLMTRRIERAMTLLRRGDLSVTEVCFTVGSSSLGTFSTRFTELVGMSPSVYRRDGARATEGIPACVAKQISRPIRNREATDSRPA